MSLIEIGERRKIGVGTMSFDISEVGQFRDALHLAMESYQIDTGRKPTHLVLGKLEQAKMSALMHIELESAYLVSRPTSSRTSYFGMDLLRSNKDSEILAVEAFENG